MLLLNRNAHVCCLSLRFSTVTAQPREEAKEVPAPARAGRPSCRTRGSRRPSALGRCPPGRRARAPRTFSMRRDPLFRGEGTFLISNFMKTGKMEEEASAKTFSNIPTEFLFDALHDITKIDKFRSTTLVAILCYQISDLRTQMFTEASSISSVNNLLQTNCSLLFKIRFSEKTAAFSTF